MVVVKGHAAMGGNEQELVVAQIKDLLLGLNSETLLEYVVRDVSVSDLHEKPLCYMVTDSEVCTSEPFLAHYNRSCREDYC